MNIQGAYIPLGIFCVRNNLTYAIWFRLPAILLKHDFLLRFEGKW